MEKKKKKRRTHWTEIDLWHYCFFDCLSLLNKDYFCFAPSLPHPECYVSVLFLEETERSIRLHLRRRGQRFGGLLLSPRRPLVSASTSSKPRLSGARCHCSVALGHGDEGWGWQKVQRSRPQCQPAAVWQQCPRLPCQSSAGLAAHWGTFLVQCGQLCANLGSKWVRNPRRLRFLCVISSISCGAHTFTAFEKSWLSRLAFVMGITELTHSLSACVLSRS